MAKEKITPNPVKEKKRKVLANIRKTREEGKQARHLNRLKKLAKKKKGDLYKHPEKYKTAA